VDAVRDLPEFMGRRSVRRPARRGAAALEAKIGGVTREWDAEILDDELHVLAASGDRAVASAAERWVGADPAVRQAWTEVEHSCDRIRAAEHREG
jgi:hypothetical protein